MAAGQTQEAAKCTKAHTGKVTARSLSHKSKGAPICAQPRTFDQRGSRMPDISIIDFTDFVLRTGSPKITKVVEIFKRGDYVPSHDFWKPLRDHICEFHEGASKQLAFAQTGAHEKKRARYEEALKGYEKFLRAEGLEWFKPHRAEWTFEDLIVRINPEVGFVLGGKPVLVKLSLSRKP
ncbi:MAG: hypothetical protein ABSD96_21595 [Candidatus Korobacteraceae bacterium]